MGEWQETGFVTVAPRAYYRWVISDYEGPLLALRLDGAGGLEFSPRFTWARVEGVLARCAARACRLDAPGPEGTHALALVGMAVADLVKLRLVLGDDPPAAVRRPMAVHPSGIGQTVEADFRAGPGEYP